ncbi:MAG: sugar phosphate isomerase/epimerase family protein [Acidobacteriaceae bacterium]
MKLAVTMVKEAPAQAPLVLRGDYTDSIRKAAQIGYDAVELHVADPAEVDVREVRAACETTGVGMSSIGTGLALVRDGLSLTSREKAARGRAIARLQDFVRLAAEFGSVVIVGLMKGLVKESTNRTEYDRHLTEALDACLPVALESGVTLVLEAMNRYESDILNTIEECVCTIEQFDSENLKLHIDTYHMNIEEDRIGRNIVAAGKHIGHVHLADSHRGYPGTGHYNFAETIAALKAVGYQGALAVECLTRPTPEVAAQGAYDAMRAVLRGNPTP